MTFPETVERYVPFDRDLALLEPWTMGGVTQSGILLSHSDDLPKVYGFIWKLHPEYLGPLTVGCMVVYPRYAYELIAEGSDVDSGKWELAIIRVSDIEAIVEFDDEDLKP